MGAVARHAKRSRTLLLDLVQGSHVSIDTAREVMKGLEAIFAASRSTARRRKAARERRSTT